MLKAVRFALVAVATLCSVLFAGPAYAGMVEAPTSDVAAPDRAASAEMLKARMMESGVDAATAAKVDRLSDEQILQALARFEGARHAGSTAIAIGLGVAIVGALLFVILETYYP
jgi:hypothetical protein